MDLVLGALLIMLMRMSDVTIGTFRMILVVQSKKYMAATAGFFEVLIWIFAMRYIVDHMDQTINLIGYAAGFAIGNLLGIFLEEKVAMGYVQLNLISQKHSVEIVEELRAARFGVTVIPAEGFEGHINLVMVIIKRKNLTKVRKLIEMIDPDVFITIQHSRPFRGFIHASRK